MPLLSAAAPVGFSLQQQCLFGKGCNHWFVIRRDDDYAGIGDGVSTTILVCVVANQRATGYQDVAIDDRSTDFRMPSDSNSRHQNTLLDMAEAVDPYVRTEHTSINTAARDDTAGRDDRVERVSVAAADLCKHELGRRRLRLVCAQRPFRIVEIELRVH